MSSTSVRSAFQRIDTEYGPTAGPSAGSQGHVGRPGRLAPADRFSANRAFDKLAGLFAVALVAGMIGYFAVPPKTAYGFMVVAFGLVLLGWFRMRWARYLAPAYSVIEGLVLGSVSRLFAGFGHGIVRVGARHRGAQPFHRFPVHHAVRGPGGFG